MSVARNLTTESHLELRSAASFTAAALEDSSSSGNSSHIPEDAELVLTAAITLCSLIARQVFRPSVRPFGHIL